MVKCVTDTDLGLIMQDIFSNFKPIPYTFLELGQGGIRGNKTLYTQDAYGVFKLRRGITNGQDVQNAISTATLHIRPDEDFLTCMKEIVGNGIAINNQKYRIIGMTNGSNFETGVLEHITLTLQVEAAV